MDNGRAVYPCVIFFKKWTCCALRRTCMVNSVNMVIPSLCCLSNITVSKILFFDFADVNFVFSFFAP